MPLIAESEEIKDVVLVHLDAHKDNRGMFLETYRRQWLPLGREMVQGNRADRIAGSVVGLHYHLHQADYWYIPFGACRIVLHDIREGSPTYGNTLTIDVGAVITEPEFIHLGVFIPPGVAHGFVALTDMTITYMVDNFYNSNDELGILWSDLEIKADWMYRKPNLSARDMQNPLIKDIPPHLKPHYGSRT
jgi:dTDP-4-dehydrorhamnose 3,5-epimerase